MIYSYISFMNWWNSYFSTLNGWEIALALILSILAIWLAVELVKFAYWLTIFSLKFSFFLVALTFNTIITLFITIPINLALGRKSLGEIFEDYAKSVHESYFAFFPSAKPKSEVKSTPVSDAKIQYVVITPSVATVSVSNASPNQMTETVLKQNELNAKTVIVSFPGANSQKEEFFCTDCGTKFTSRMQGLLTQKNFTFCEKCGKKYVSMNGIPSPV